jgi:hypothetical protein
MARSRRDRSLTGRLVSMALRRGMRGGSRTWFSIAATAQAFRVLARVTGRKPEVLRIRLRPGEGVEIRELPRSR